MEYRDFIDDKANEIITELGGTITPAPANAELYRDFLERKFDDVINAIDNVKVKTLEYTGDSQATKTITFPSKPLFVLGIFTKRNDPTQNSRHLDGFPYGVDKSTSTLMYTSTTQGAQVRTVFLTYNDNEITLDGGTSAQSMNASSMPYTVYYI